MAIAIIAVIVLLQQGATPDQTPTTAEEQPAAIEKPVEEAPEVSTTEGLPDSAAAIAQERGLTADQVTAALMTYMPTGEHDEYIMFSSAGHGGQMLVIGVPSMRLLKVVGVFTPEPWQGWGFGSKDTEEDNHEEGESS